jgi:hypothetical protein
MLRPSVHPSFWSASRNAAYQACASESAHQHADPPHPLWLLRPRRERPRGRAAEKQAKSSR